MVVPRVNRNEGGGVDRITSLNYLMVITVVLVVVGAGISIFGLVAWIDLQEQRQSIASLVQKDMVLMELAQKNISSSSGTVVLVETGTGLEGGPITESGTISLSDTTVVPGTFTLSTVTVDQQGRVTSAASGSIDVGVTSVSTGTGLTGGPVTSSGTLSLADTLVTPGSYTHASITVDQQGRITSASSGTVDSGVTSIATGAGLTGGPVTTSGTISLAPSGVTPGSYGSGSAIPVMTVDTYGRVTSASTTSLSAVTGVSVDGMSGLEVDLSGPGTISSTGSLSLTATGVVSGSYTFASITVDAKGRLTAASSGTDYGSTISMIQMDIVGLTNAISMINMTAIDPLSVNASLAQLMMDIEMIKAVNATVSLVDTGVGLTGGPITSSGTISLTNTAVTPGTYTLSTVTVDQQGRITAAASGNAVTSVNSGTGLTGGPITSSGTLSLANTSVTPGAYSLASFTVDQQGRLTSASSGSAVTSVGTGAGLTGGPITSSGTISLAPSGVTPSTYGSSSLIPILSIDTYGRVTSASTTALSAVTAVSVDGMSGLEVNHAGPGTISSTGSLSLTNTTVVSGMYTYATIVVDPQGRITSAASGMDYGSAISMLQTDIMGIETAIMDLNVTISALDVIDGVNASLSQLILDVDMLKAVGATVKQVDTGIGLTGGPITTTGTISLTNTSVTPGTYSFASIMVDQQGRITMASSGSAITSITAGTGLTGGTITSSGTIAIEDTGVVAGVYGPFNKFAGLPALSYFSADRVRLQIDSTGRIVKAENISPEILHLSVATSEATVIDANFGTWPYKNTIVWSGGTAYRATAADRANFTSVVCKSNTNNLNTLYTESRPCLSPDGLKICGLHGGNAASYAATLFPPLYRLTVTLTLDANDFATLITWPLSSGVPASELNLHRWDVSGTKTVSFLLKKVGYCISIVTRTPRIAYGILQGDITTRGSSISELILEQISGGVMGGGDEFTKEWYDSGLVL